MAVTDGPYLPLMNTIPNGPDDNLPPPPPPPRQPYTLSPQIHGPPSVGHPTAAWVFGTFSCITGLIPILFVVSLPAGIVAFVLGVAAFQAGRRNSVTQGRAGIALGLIGTVLGIIGMAIFFRTVDEIDQILEDGLEGAQPPQQTITPTTIDADTVWSELS